MRFKHKDSIFVIITLVVVTTFAFVYPVLADIVIFEQPVRGGVLLIQYDNDTIKEANIRTTENGDGTITVDVYSDKYSSLEEPNITFQYNESEIDPSYELAPEGGGGGSYQLIYDGMDAGYTHDSLGGMVINIDSDISPTNTLQPTDTLYEAMVKGSFTFWFWLIIAIIGVFIILPMINITRPRRTEYKVKKEPDTYIKIDKGTNNGGQS